MSNYSDYTNDYMDRVDKMFKILDNIQSYYREDRFKKLLDESKSETLDRSITLNAAAGSFLIDNLSFNTPSQHKSLEASSATEKYPIGEYKGIRIYIDPNMKWSDLRIFDSNDNIIEDLEDHGFTPRNII